MTDDHDVRRALAAYADTTPFLDPRDGLGARITRHTRVRRAAVVGTAAVALVIAGSGVAALTRDGGTAAVVAKDGTRSGTPTGSPSAQPGGPIVREAGGPDGLRVRVTLTPGDLDTGTPATLTVRSEDDDAVPQLTEVSFGDGVSESEPPGTPNGCAIGHAPTSPQPSPEPGGGVMTETFQHAWRHAGRYTVTVSAQSDVWCAEDPRTERQTVTFEIDVAAGPVTSNGPHRAAGEAKWERILGAGIAQTRYALTALFTDPDGHVTAASIDWGDGSAPQLVANEHLCDDNGGRSYPEQGELYLMEEHEFPRAGTYTVTVSASSTGCDGQGKDDVVRTVEVTIP